MNKTDNIHSVMSGVLSCSWTLLTTNWLAVVMKAAGYEEEEEKPSDSQWLSPVMVSVNMDTIDKSL